jgi:hypothetical protein
MTFDWTPTVLSNTGCQFRFYPLLAFGRKEAPNLAQTLWDEVEGFSKRHDAFMQAVAEGSVAALDGWKKDVRKWPWRLWKDCQFVRERLAIKTYQGYEILGIELAIETTAPGDRYNEYGFLYNTVTALEGKNKHAAQYGSVYQQVPDGTYFPPEAEAAKCFEVVEGLFNVNIRIGFLSVITAGGALGAHLVIDIGNTRSSALLLKDDAAGVLDNVDLIRSSCAPVLLNLPTKTEAVSRSDIRNVDNGIVSSWFMLHQNEFDEAKPSVLQRKYISKTIKRFFGLKTETLNVAEEQRIPAMFIRYSPVIIGKEAEKFLADSRVTGMIEKGLQIQQSSPKRYFAEGEKTRLDWSMIPNMLNEEANAITANKLCSNLLYWMDASGGFIDPNQTEAYLRPLRDPEHPNFPRSATFVWMLVGILERAWDQCNRIADANGTFTPYQIQDVIVTYPSGWTRDEISLYKKRCEDAVRIFERTNFSRETQIKLHMNVDEAVASQLPFVFSEIHKYGDNAEGWFRFAGKERGEGKTTFRIMNLDIGGGTTDISIVEYECLKGDEDGVTDLQPRLLFRDGYSEAGDELMRRIIEQIIFPAIEAKNAEGGAAVRRYFTGMPASEPIRAQRSKDLKLCIIPLAIKVMKELSSGAPNGRFAVKDCLGSWASWKDDFFVHLRLTSDRDQWLGVEIEYDIAQVNQLVSSFFRTAFDNASKIAAAYDIDMFFMSGKTSELPELYRLACEYMPVTNDRIKTAKNYRAGDWYPFVKTDENDNIIDNTVKDAKSITAVGAALNYMLANQKVRGWKIRETIFAVEGDSDWGFLDAFMRPDGKGFEFDAAGVAKVRLDTHKLIARRMTKGAFPSAVYKLRSRDLDHSANANERFCASFRRGRDERTNAEYLELIALTRDMDGHAVDCMGQYELAVCQGGDLFWQDSGCVIQ